MINGFGSESLLREWSEMKDLVQMKVPFDLDKATAAIFRVGSHSHGTYVPPEDPNGVDDHDYMLIVIPPPNIKLGMKDFDSATYQHGKLDVVIYEWSKWLRLLEKSNPNVIGNLWSHPEDFYFPRSIAPIYSLFLGKDKLLSKKLYPAFIGYARSQLHKMTHHAHMGYMGEKRKTLVEKYGYDTKNAAHLIRLMRMAKEALETGVMNVRRPDAAEIIEIKQGKWTLRQVIEESDRLFAASEGALKETKLADFPDSTLLQKVMVDGYLQWW